jgi:hypothetical protein
MVGKLYGVPIHAATAASRSSTWASMRAHSSRRSHELARRLLRQRGVPSYKVVFFASGIGMLISLVWFYFGRAQLQGIGLPPAGGTSRVRILLVASARCSPIPVVYFLFALGAGCCSGS